MLYRIKFISDEVDGFVREIQIDSDATFLDLSRAILKSCNYPDDQMTSFYLCNEEWERHEQVTREDMGAGSVDEDIYVMADTRLSELIEGEEQRLEYVFDPFADRCFFLDVKEEIPGQHLDEPVITRSKGDAPKQIEELDLDLEAPATTKKGTSTADDDFDDTNFYGDASFDSEDFDPEGFEFSEGQPY